MTIMVGASDRRNDEREGDAPQDEMLADSIVLPESIANKRVRDITPEETEVGKAYIRSRSTRRVRSDKADGDASGDDSTDARTRRTMARRTAMRESQGSDDDAESRFNEEVGERLRHVREVLGLQLIEVANQLNVTRQTLSNYESGRTPLRASVIRELAEIYDIPCDWILGVHDQIEIHSSSNGRTLYMRETSPRIYPASVNSNEDRQKWDEAQIRKQAQLSRMEETSF